MAEGRHLSDEYTIHFGLLPRTHRGIFCINELPDLTEKVQVGLFNVMEERDIQVKGYRVRLPMDVFVVASANPEDYTARGKIITPLKDRIGSEVRTHYPTTLEHGVAITQQEAWTDRDANLHLPRYVREVVEGIAFAARRRVFLLSPTLELLDTPLWFPNQVEAVEFSPSGDRLAAGSRDGTVKLFEFSSRESRTLLAGIGPGALDVTLGTEDRLVVEVGIIIPV